MTDILVKPQELRQTAEQLHASAKKISGATGSIGKIVLGSALRLVFTGNRASALMKRYLSKAGELAAFDDLVVKFASDLEQAANRFEQMDKTTDSRTDRRVDRRIESDRRWRRSEGGDGNGHLSYDWAGGAILERYLTGGDDLYINNDERWTQYMQNNSTLTNDLLNRAKNTAASMYSEGRFHVKIDESYSMALENGEGIVGYQYLHGTNANVGGFQRVGDATMSSDDNGGYTVTLKMTYTWNDIIDPNPDYSTDIIKGGFAEFITLGKADPYSIHISWDETTVIKLDKNGNVISVANS